MLRQYPMKSPSAIELTRWKLCLSLMSPLSSILECIAHWGNFSGHVPMANKAALGHWGNSGYWESQIIVISMTDEIAFNIVGLIEYQKNLWKAILII